MSKKHKSLIGAIDVPGIGCFVIAPMATVDTNWVDILNSAAGSASWEANPVVVADKEVIPYGSNNKFPSDIRTIMDANNLAPGILERELGLLWGVGPKLYTEKFTDGKLTRVYLNDAEIEKWLKTWDWEDYVYKATVEYKYLKAHYTKFHANKGSEIGRTFKIAKLSCIPSSDARLGWVNTRKFEDIKYIHIGDFDNNCQNGMVTLPVFNRFKPAANPLSAYYYSSYSFARVFYTMPSYYGSLAWIQRSSDVPLVLKNLLTNGMAPSYMIKVPSEYWADKQQRLEEQCKEKGIQYTTAMFEDMKNKVFENVKSVLSGKANVGKMIETVEFMDDHGTRCSWTIEAIDHKIKDYIDAQLKISEKADGATTSGIGLHPALSNIIVEGKLASGSEMLYAFKLYLASDTSIPERVIMQGINQAIEINFPNKNVKMGFYHDIVLKEEDTTPNERIAKTK
jgi:hypothetical protein